jgi:hypothetical protein
MRNTIRRIAPAGLTLVAVLFVARSLAAQSDTSHQMAHDAMAHDTMAHDAKTMSTHGSFTGLNKHKASGGFEVVTANDKQEIRLTPDFSLDQAPDVYLVLSTSATVDAKSLYVGRLGNFSGVSSFSLPAGTDLARYSHLVLWCKKFSVALGDASLETGDAMMHH